MQTVYRPVYHHLPYTHSCTLLEFIILDVCLIYRKSSITTTVITIASKMMIMTTLEAMAAVFVEAYAEGKKLSNINWNRML